MLVWPETQLWNVCRPTCSIPGPSHTMCRTSIFKQRTEHARTQCEARPDTREGGRERSKRSKQKHREIKSTKPNNQKPPERATGGRRADGRSNSGTMSVTDDAAAAEPGCGGSGLLVEDRASPSSIGRICARRRRRDDTCPSTGEPRDEPPHDDTDSRRVSSWSCQHSTRE